MSGRIPTLAAICVGLAASCLYARPGAAKPRIARQVVQPTTSVALPAGTVGWFGNPATGPLGLSLGGRAALGGNGPNRGAGWGVHGGLPLGPVQLGLGAEHVVEPAPDAAASPALVPNRYTIAASTTLDSWLHLGLALRWISDVPQALSPLNSLDFGLRATPWPWLSLGLYVTDVMGQSLYRYPPEADVISGPVYYGGVAVMDGDGTFSVSLDLRWPNGGALDGVRGMASVRLSGAKSTAQRHLGAALQWFGRTGQLNSSAITVFYRVSGEWFAAEVAPLRQAQDDASHWALSGGALVQHQPKRGLWQAARRHLKSRRNRSAQRASAAHLADIARRQQRGWEAPLVGVAQAHAAAVAKSFLSISRALAEEDATSLCGQFSEYVRLDVTSTVPKLRIGERLPRKAACAALQRPGSNWASYLKELGPSAVHAGAPIVVGRLFAMHGSPYEWIPRKQEQAYALALHKAKAPCTIWRVLPVRASKSGHRVVDVVVQCSSASDFVLRLGGTTDTGYKLMKLLHVTR
ncbi:MAG: hypothetical protein KC502_07510 [Myxococcales bacterium]|nr:hypothetical protein [Myxococcales bacterium]